LLLVQLDTAIDKGFKGTAADSVDQSKPSKPNRPPSHLPLPKNNNGVHSLTLLFIIAKPMPQNGSGSGGGGSSSAGGVDIVIAESVSEKEVGRLNIAKNTTQLITKWANEPPTQPPQHFLFSTHL